MMNGQLNLKHLHYFYEVAQKGSIAEASRALRGSSSTISEQVRLLEGKLGRPLFLRSPQGLRLTEAGRVVYQQAEVVFESIDRMLEHFKMSDEDRTPVLRVGNASSLARSQTAADLVPLLAIPDLRVRVQTASGDALVRSLLDGELDLVLSDREPPRDLNNTLHAEPLQGSPLAVVVGPRTYEEMPDGMEGLKRVPLLQYMVSSRHRWDVEQWLNSQDLSPRILGEVDDVSLLLAAARADMCFAVVPQASLVDAGQGLRVVANLDDQIRTERYAIYRDGKPLEAVQMAVRQLKRHSCPPPAPSADD